MVEAAVGARFVERWRRDRARRLSPPRPVSAVARRVGLLVCVVILGLAGCQPARAVGRGGGSASGQVLRINVQPGLAYAPLLVMQSRRLLERRVPGLSIEWKTIFQPDLVHDALASGGLDIATGSPTAFLLGRERGLPARVLAGVSELPIAVISRRGDLRSLRDLRVEDRVAVPSSDSHERTVLRMAALRELGDARALDRLVVTRPHRDALAALLGRGDLTAQVTVPPFLDRALESPGVRRLVDGAEVIGGASPYLLAFTTPPARRERPELFEAFVDALREAGDLAVGNPAEMARLLAERAHAEGEEPRPAAAGVARRTDRGDVLFSAEVRGLTRVAEFLRHVGQLERSSAAWGDLVFDDVQGW